jgi:hypothetical protein
MALAACYGVWQLAVLGSLTRSARIGTLLLSVPVGLYVCGPVAVGLQLAYTRGLAAATGVPLYQVVTTASYTVDPLIEELAKVLPVLVVACWSRVRRQWGLTDYLLLGAGCGAGFGLAEDLLRYSHQADKALAAPGGGWMIPVNLSVPHVPDLGQILSAWLPAPVGDLDLFSTAPIGGLDLHLIWSAAVGLGVGVLLRTRWWIRPLGLLPIAAA